MELMRHFWDVAIEQDAVPANAESLMLEICKPQPLREAFRPAALSLSETGREDLRRRLQARAYRPSRTAPCT